ncbi:MAG: hypothetical protein KF883_01450 [Thermomicrobiales bacterium]|nr:hypothetical protein [Thermomicrobiales bacterium]
MTYEIAHKPTFTSQLLAVPGEIQQILKKVQMLEEEPQPDAKNKKRLVV